MSFFGEILPMEKRLLALARKKEQQAKQNNWEVHKMACCVAQANKL
jgi:hypothetical protein